MPCKDGHNFIVTSWRISDHSQSAQEVMCTKCLTNLNIEGINTARANLITCCEQVRKDLSEDDIYI